MVVLNREYGNRRSEFHGGESNYIGKAMLVLARFNSLDIFIARTLPRPRPQKNGQISARSKPTKSTVQQMKTLTNEKNRNFHNSPKYQNT